MINLYDKRETNFEKNGEVVLSDCTSCFITQELNGAYYLELVYPKDERGKYKYLDGWNIIKADGQLFRIPVLTNIQDDDVTIKVRANHIFYDLYNDFNEDTRAENQTVQQALSIAIAVNPKFTAGPCDDLGTNTAYFVSENPVKGIFDKVIKRWGGELYRDNYNVAVKQRLGADKGVQVAYGKNILGFEQTLDWNNVATKIKPVGKDGITIDLVNAGSKYLLSPRANDYPFIITKEVKFEDIDDATQLKNAALALWGIIDLPSANYKVNFLDLAKVEEYELIKSLIELELGDTVTIRHKIFNIDLTARVIRIKKNVLTDKIEEIEIGQFKSNLSSKFSNIDNQIQYTQQSIAKTKEDLTETKTTVQQNNEQIGLQAERISDNEEAITQVNLRADGIETEVSKKINGQEAKTIVSQSATEIRAAINNTHYSFTEDSFKIGSNDSGDTAEHTPDHSRWEHSDGTYTEVSAAGLVHKSGTSENPYHYLYHIQEVIPPPYSGPGSGGSDFWVDIPEEFANKDFKALVSISKIQTNYVPSTFGLTSDVQVSVVDRDIVNAKVRIFAYLSLYDKANDTWHTQNEHLTLLLQVLV